MRKESLPSGSSYLLYSLVGLRTAAQRIMGVHGGPAKHDKSNPAGYKNDHQTELGLSHVCKGGFTLGELHTKFAIIIG